MEKSIISIILFILLTTPSPAQREHTLTPEEKLYGLSRFWQEVNYNFAFFGQVPHLDWDSAYQAYIPKVLAAESDYDYYRTLERFCALLQDGHTNVYMPRRIDSLVYRTSFGDYRLFLENINGRAIVTHVNEPKKEEIPVGSEVIQVNGMPAKEYMEKEIIPYISSSTDYILQDIGAGSLLKGLAGESIDIRIRRPDGEERDFHLTRALNKEDIYPPFPEWALLEFKWLEEGVAYIALNSFGDPKIDTLFIEKVPELLRSKALVIDLRRNGGGSTDIGLAIAKYLTEDTLLYGSRSMTREHRAAFKAWGSWVADDNIDTVGNDWAKKSLDYYNGAVWHEFEYEPDTNDVEGPRIVVPTVILTGHNTASAAEDFLVYLDKQPHITRMGRKTFGSTGQPLLFELPGGGSARVCTKKDVFPDGREFVGYGIIPQIEVNPTVEDFIQGRDRALEKAVEVLKGKL